jgi:hypothetical protein
MKGQLDNQNQRVQIEKEKHGEFLSILSSLRCLICGGDGKNPHMASPTFASPCWISLAM